MLMQILSLIATGHPLSETKQQTPVTLTYPSEQVPKLSRESLLFGQFAPLQWVCSRFIGRFRRYPIAEQLIKRNFKGASKLLERFHARNRVAVFNARDVITQKARSRFDVSLTELLMLAEFPKA